jgi:hypothetical protein
VNRYGFHDRLSVPDGDDPAVEIDDIGAILRDERAPARRSRPTMEPDFIIP